MIFYLNNVPATLRVFSRILMQHASQPIMRHPVASSLPLDLAGDGERVGKVTCAKADGHNIPGICRGALVSAPHQYQAESQEGQDRCRGSDYGIQVQHQTQVTHELGDQLK